MEIVADASEKTDRGMAKEDAKDRHKADHARADRVKNQQEGKTEKTPDKGKDDSGFLSRMREKRAQKKDRGR